MDQTGPGKDLVKLLEQFKHDGISMGIVTFVRQIRLAKRLEKWNIRKYFSTTISPEQVSEFKPSPKPYLKALTHMHLSSSECAVVGDEPVDMLGGKRAGTQTIGIPNGFYSREELVKAGADSIITSIYELPSLVSR